MTTSGIRVGTRGMRGHGDEAFIGAALDTAQDDAALVHPGPGEGARAGLPAVRLPTGKPTRASRRACMRCRSARMPKTRSSTHASRYGELRHPAAYECLACSAASRRMSECWFHLSRRMINLSNT